MVKMRVTLLCDGDCKHGNKQASVKTEACFVDGEFCVTLPDGWRKFGDHYFCSQCVEYEISRKLLKTEIPKDNVPRELRKAQLGYMEELLRAEKEGRDARFGDLDDFVSKVCDFDGDPDFRGSLGNDGELKIAVWVCDDSVFLKFNGQIDLIVSFDHESKKLIDPPEFIKDEILSWVQGCLFSRMGCRFSGSGMTGQEFREVMSRFRKSLESVQGTGCWH